jgi:tetratricopeptide (TPR) repeat protein
MPKARRRTKKNKMRRASLPSLQTVLAEARALIDEEKLEEARYLLDGLHERFPTNVDVLAELLELSDTLEDAESMLTYAEDLYEIVGDDPYVLCSLGYAYFETAMPVHTIRTFRRLLELFPEHQAAVTPRKLLSTCESSAAELYESIGLMNEEAEETVGLLEEVRSLTFRGDYQSARELAEQAHLRSPRFSVALQVLSRIASEQGDLVAAIEYAERALALDPADCRALSAYCYLLLLTGQPEKAADAANRLRNAALTDPEDWLAKVRALSYLGQDKAVLEVYDRADKAGYTRPEEADPQFFHLAAVAALRLGDEKKARRLWKAALDAKPEYANAVANLDDFKRPVGERSGPFAFRLDEWLPTAWYDRLEEILAVLHENTQSDGVGLVTDLIKQHPELIALVPLWLDRGDEGTRHLGIVFAQASGSADALSAVKQFALGKRGPDETRLYALRCCVSEGLLPPGENRVWRNGDWRTVIVVGFEIHTDAEAGLTRSQSKLMERGMSLLTGERYAEAESVFRELCEKAPNHPSAFNNLALTIERQGRDSESRDLIVEMQRRFPDYFFGIIAAANAATINREFDKAEALLRPLLLRKRIHLTEFSSLCRAEVQLAVAKKERERARAWIDMEIALLGENED